jgi:hypothetical protein
MMRVPAKYSVVSLVSTERSVARIPLYDELDTVKADVSAISPADAARRITGHIAVG